MEPKLLTILSILQAQAMAVAMLITIGGCMSLINMPILAKLKMRIILCLNIQAELPKAEIGM